MSYLTREVAKHRRIGYAREFDTSVVKQIKRGIEYMYRNHLRPICLKCELIDGRIVLIPWKFVPDELRKQFKPQKSIEDSDETIWWI